MRTINSSISLSIGGRPGVRRARHRICERQAFGTTPKWCPAQQQSPPRRAPCGPVGGRFRQASLARLPRASGAPSTAPQDPIFGSQVLIGQEQFLIHGPGDVRHCVKKTRKRQEGSGDLAHSSCASDDLMMNEGFAGELTRLSLLALWRMVKVVAHQSVRSQYRGDPRLRRIH
jgi:hypothetical protein